MGKFFKFGGNGGIVKFFEFSGNGGIFSFSGNGGNAQIWWKWRKYSNSVEFSLFGGNGVVSEFCEYFRAEMAEFSNSAEIVEILGFSGNGGLVKFGGNY